MAAREPLLSAFKGEHGARGCPIVRAPPIRVSLLGSLYGLTRCLRCAVPGWEEVPLPFQPVSPCSEVPAWLLWVQLFPDPHIGAVLRLRGDGSPCTDASPHLAAACALLEGALRKGLRREWHRGGEGMEWGFCVQSRPLRLFCTAEPLWGFRRRDYWQCLEQLSLGEGGR